MFERLRADEALLITAVESFTELGLLIRKEVRPPTVRSTAPNKRRRNLLNAGFCLSRDLNVFVAASSDDYSFEIEISDAFHNYEATYTRAVTGKNNRDLSGSVLNAEDCRETSLWQL